MKTFTLVMITVLLTFGAAAVSLQDCIDGARRSSPISANLVSVEGQQLLKMKALQTAYYPNLYLNGEVGMNSEVTQISLGSNLPVKTPQPDKDRESMGFEIRQLIWDGGITKGQKRLVNLEADLKTKEYLSNLNTLEMEVISQYYLVIHLGLSINATRIHLENQNVLMGIMRTGMDNGVREKADVLLLSNVIIDLEDKLNELISRKQTAIDTLNRLCSLKVDYDEVFVSPCLTLSSGEELHKPELEKLGIMAEIQNENAKLSRRKNFPQISVRISGAWGKPGYDIFSTEFHDYYSAGVVFNWRIWDWSQRSYESKTARIEAEQVIMNKESMELGIRNELAALDNESKQLQDSIAKRLEKLVLLKQLKQIYEDKYANGLITTSDLLVQSNNVLSAELELLECETKLSGLNIKRIYLTGDRL